LPISIGSHLRAIRKSQSMTLQQLSSQTGFSIGYLSNIERDLVSPTIQVLSDICTALSIDMTTFLQPLSAKKPVFKKADREIVYQSTSQKVQYESITPDGFPLKGLCVILQPGGTSTEGQDENGNSLPHAHASDELGIVLQGTLELMIGKKKYLLEEGHSFCIESGVPHWYKNTGDGVSIHYSINTGHL
jgi:transcriptional regulator with XRE-family HTH domain